MMFSHTNTINSSLGPRKCQHINPPQFCCSKRIQKWQDERLLGLAGIADGLALRPELVNSDYEALTCWRTPGDSLRVSWPGPHRPGILCGNRMGSVCAPSTYTANSIFTEQEGILSLHLKGGMNDNAPSSTGLHFLEMFFYKH